MLKSDLTHILHPWNCCPVRLSSGVVDILMQSWPKASKQEQAKTVQSSCEDVSPEELTAQPEVALTTK